MKKSIYIFSKGLLKRKDNTIRFYCEEADKYIPVENISDIYAFGDIDVTKKLLELLSQKDIMLHYYNYYGYYMGSFYPREHYNSGYMILNQAKIYLDNERRLKLAKSFVKGSIDNILGVLKYYSSRGKNIEVFIERILQINSSIDEVDSISALMGLEGNARDLYYGTFDEIIKQEDFLFEQRTRRPPLNYLNTLISFGNSLMYTTVLSEIYRTHLDPRIGFLHATNFRRFSLNLDVAEIFKPIIVDRVIFTLLNKGSIKIKHFEKDMGGILLKDTGKKIFLEAYDNRLSTTINHKGLKRKVSYRQLIRLELYKLQKHFMEEKEYIPYKHSF
jgi:CRISPR-associated protein Cas1